MAVMLETFRAYFRLYKLFLFSSKLHSTFFRRSNVKPVEPFSEPKFNKMSDAKWYLSIGHNELS